MNLNKTLIGMLHVPALPGTPKNRLNPDQIIDQTVEEAKVLANAGFDALLLENMHDVPYLKGAVGPEIVAMLTAVAKAVVDSVDIPVGIQVLAAANKEALAVAKAAGLSFIRAEGFVFGHLGDEGYHDSCAAELLRYRKMIGAEQVKIYTDIKKKHSSHQMTADVSLEETAKAAAFFLSDGLIITGTSTGQPVKVTHLESLQNKTVLPLLIGSGVTNENIAGLWPLADAFIVGSHIKKDGFWANELDPSRIESLVAEVNRLKG